MSIMKQLSELNVSFDGCEYYNKCVPTLMCFTSINIDLTHSNLTRFKNL